jgi:hypothetical protein
MLGARARQERDAISIIADPRNWHNLNRLQHHNVRDRHLPE